LYYKENIVNGYAVNRLPLAVNRIKMNRKKLWLIINREYLTRVKKRSFILMTFLTPVIMVAFMVIAGFIFAYQGEKSRIAVKDDSGLNMVISSSSQKIVFLNQKDNLESLKEDYIENGFDGLLHIPVIKNINNEVRPQYYSEKQLSLSTIALIENRIAKKLRQEKIKALNLSEKDVENIETSNVSLEEKSITVGEDGKLKEEEKTNNAAIATAIGGVMGFLVYIVLFVYGMMVMRSVMEEKMNRIVEVMISSVKPFELMLGKIIGVGFVGLTQFTIWALLTTGLMFIAGFFMPDIDPSSMQMTGANAPDVEAMEYQIAQTISLIGQQNWWLILSTFIFYFLGGYFLYASLFAAVGSAMGDDLGEGQALTLPITIPIILAIYIMFAVIENPNSSLATWSSIFPLFSPIVMPARIAFEPAWWELGISMIVLLATSIFFVWLSGRIYRVGILMYGKKVTLKELGKWMFYKD
jgi:ABC-2 type transport system permease protein